MKMEKNTRLREGPWGRVGKGSSSAFISKIDDIYLIIAECLD
jgi:hypothetical protein